MPGAHQLLAICAAFVRCIPVKAVLAGRNVKLVADPKIRGEGSTNKTHSVSGFMAHRLTNGADRVDMTVVPTLEKFLRSENVADCCLVSSIRWRDSLQNGQKFEAAGASATDNFSLPPSPLHVRPLSIECSGLWTFSPQDWLTVTALLSASSFGFLQWTFPLPIAAFDPYSFSNLLSSCIRLKQYTTTMSLWRVVTLLAMVIASVRAHGDNATVATVFPAELNATAGSVRRLANAAPGNVAACYAPFHNNAYPLFGGSLDLNALRAAMDDDFKMMSKYFTHVRTYYSQHFGIEVAPIAAKYGLKLYLGVYMTSESWAADEVNAAANAIKSYSGTVEVVLAGNENLQGFYQRSWDIINKINEVKSKAGSDAWRVKYGTVQRVNEFVDSRFDWDMWQLSNNLDILGVNIYPFFTDSYNANNPTALLDAQWNTVTSKYPRDKIRLTETGFPTAGAPSSLSPHVQPSLDSAVKYYQGVVNWTPSGYTNLPKFWFQAFDRRYGDPSAPVDLELYFGFFTTEKYVKRDGFPQAVGSVVAVSSLMATCTVEEGVDYSGTDVGNAKSSSAESCFSLCNSFSGCGAFTWTSYNGGTCWFKSSKGSSKSNSAARSGVACASGQVSSTCTIDEGADYSGTDVGNAKGAKAEACFALCNNFKGCSAFTWTSYNGGTCWFKSTKGNSSSNGDARSALTCTCNLGGLEVGIDYAGNDIANTPGLTAEACISKCQSQSGCKAFTWSGYNGGTCYLKSGKGSTSSNSAVTSGVIC